MKPVVLVTAIGTAASTTIVSTLKKTGNYYIIGADIYCSNQVATAKDVDKFYKFPSAVYDLDGYIKFVVDFCKQHKVNFYFATIDEEVVNLSKNRRLFDEAGVKLCIPNDELISICHFKNRFYVWIKENIPEILMKTYSNITSIDYIEFPVFIKPVEGRGSIGCRKIDDKNVLIQLIHEGLKLDDYVIQQYFDGDVISVDLIQNLKTNQRIQIQRKEELRNASGCGIAVKILNDSRLEMICNTLMKKLNLNGVVNAEFFYCDGEYKIIEINPRFPAGTSFSVLAGCNMPLNAIKIANGEPCIDCDIAYGKHLAKRYETYSMD